MTTRTAHGRWKRIVTSSVIFILIVAALTAPTIAQTLYLISPEPDAWDPIDGTEGAAAQLVSLYARPLYRYATNENYTEIYNPLLAKSEPIQFGPNGKDSIKVPISPDAYFRRVTGDAIEKNRKVDSLKVTAADVVATWRFLINSSPEAKLRRWGSIDRLEKYVKEMKATHPDTVTVVFGTRAPRPPEQVLAFPIVPASALSINKESMNAYRDFPWGAGPFCMDQPLSECNDGKYKFRRSQETDEMDQRFDLINIDVPSTKMEWETWLRNSRVSVCSPAIPLGTSNVVDKGSMKLYPIRTPAVDVVIFNCKKDDPPLKEYLVRQALSLFIDRLSLSRDWYNEVDTVSGPIAYGDPFYCNKCIDSMAKYDSTVALQKLQQAGFKRNASTKFWQRSDKPLKIKLMYAAGDNMRDQLASAIRNGWTTGGVDAALEKLPPPLFMERLAKKDFDAAIYRISYQGFTNLGRFFTRDGKQNYSQFDDKKTDSLWNSFSTVGSTTQVQDIWNNLQQRIGVLVPCAFLWTPKTYAIASHVVTVEDQWCFYNFICQIENWSE